MILLRLVLLHHCHQQKEWERGHHQITMENREVKPKLKKGFWRPEEDLILKKYVEIHGEGKWRIVSEKSGNLALNCLPFTFCGSLQEKNYSNFFSLFAGLKRGGRSCRLRWKNYLRPNIKRGEMSEEEKDLIIRLHKLLGNRSVLFCFYSSSHHSRAFSYLKLSFQLASIAKDSSSC